MSVWAELDVLERVQEVLDDVPVGEPHVFGRPFISAYQLAIEVDRRYPEIREALGTDLGGAGIGARSSFSQYLARELSRRIGADHAYPVEGAFLDNMHVDLLRFRDAGGAPVVSSLTDSGYDLSLFRRRD
jgi:hypothetical protein